LRAAPNWGRVTSHPGTPLNQALNSWLYVPDCYSIIKLIQVKFKIYYTRNVPLVLMLCIKSYLFMSVSNVPVNDIALALFMTISIPPNTSTALLTASII